MTLSYTLHTFSTLISTSITDNRLTDVVSEYHRPLPASDQAFEPGINSSVSNSLIQ